tara:strand:+ start:180 stop:497 length:318 start_codon:yes stop_codon:yes gene_type:complete
MSNTNTKTVVMSLKELNYVLPNLETVKKVENSANKILHIGIKGDIVTVEAEVVVAKTKKVTTTTAKKTTATTAKKAATTKVTTGDKTTTAKKTTTTTRTKNKKNS